MVVALLALVFVLNPPTDAPLPALPDARAVTITTLPQADDILVVPDAKHIPQEWWPALEAHMNQGGRTLLIGTDPFAARVRGEETEAELFARLAKESRPWCDFSNWQR